ncbi:MAG: tetraacyldisaccharide 4'-kinase [Ignavibacteria bacterium]|nr:tetraacyldisaccharide 4'-kinase [Ignavibacteria bacterium]
MNTLGKILRILLLPLSLVYSVLMSVRNMLFDMRILRSLKKDVPVISVGNITTGGTGKTPVTLWLAEYLIRNEKRVAVISRGYGRRSAGLRLVCDGKSISSDVMTSGDELMMISDELLSRYPGEFVVVACADRSKAIDFAVKEHNAETVILDDAFQHRHVARDLDIVLLNAEEFDRDPLSHIFTVPTGNLRESRRALARAGIIIWNSKTSVVRMPGFIQRYSGKIIEMSYNSEYFVDSENTIFENIEGKVVAFCGLADNLSFFTAVRKKCKDVHAEIGFSDHHAYTESDFKRLLNKLPADGRLVTSQKDFVKVKERGNFARDNNVCYLKLGIELKSPEKLTKKIDSIIK